MNSVVFKTGSCCIISHNVYFWNGQTFALSANQSHAISFLRYDVELFQRIEHLIGKKLPVFPTQDDEVMMLTERVTEAQRFARMVCNLFSHQLKCK